MYAIIETGGKQYKVSPGQLIDVERLDVAAGKTVEVDRVLLIADGDKITTGMPVVDGARVVATAQDNGKGKKIIVFKYKAKTRYSKKTGHRQLYTRLMIDKISAPGFEEAKPAKTTRKRARRTKKEETADGA
ncbi:50S ribosomal protein L21 [Chloroflexota bacterium]